MDAVNRIEAYLRGHAGTPSALLLGQLGRALERDDPFPLERLYRMDYQAFELALALITEWRTDRYFAHHIGLLDRVKAAAHDEDAQAAIA